MTVDTDPESLIDIPTAPTTNLLPRKKKVKAWHAPRKQWIRIYQWNAQIEGLIDEIQSTQVDLVSDISYLSLPGTELLDIRMVLQLCNAKNVRLKFLGFNDPERESTKDVTALNISESELKQQPNVHPGSVVVKDKLEQLAAQTSTAQLALEHFGSLDVINLDLTHCVANLAPNGLQGDYYRAIHQLFEHQRNRRVKPFLFFITTRVHPQLIDRSAFGILLGVLSQNFKLHSSFAEKMKGCFGIETSDIAAAQNDNGFDAIAKYLDKVFSMALGKWMLNLLLGGGPQWAIEMQESCSYTVHASGDPDMFSFAFICRPIKQASFDHAGLSGLVAAQPFVAVNHELQFAERLIEAVTKVFDLDRRLNGDDQLKGELVHAATELMRQAGYDPADYALEARKQLEKIAGWLYERSTAVST